MSVRIMSAIWEMGQLSPTEKLVLLALADWSNDAGECWPSIARVAEKTGVGTRTVQRAIRKAEKEGIVKRDEVLGKGNRYTINPCHNDTPATVTPLPERQGTPATVAPNTSRHTSRKKDKPSSKRVREKFDLPDDIPKAEWDGFVEMRKSIGKRLTVNAMHLAVKRLRKLRDEDGWPPGDVLEHSTLNSYQGLFPPKDRRNERPQQQPASRNDEALGNFLASP